MDKRTLLIAYLVGWIACVLVLHWYGWRKRLDHYVVGFAHSVPSLVAILMTRIFLIGQGAAVRQFVADSEQGMELWTLWFRLWPLLFFLTLAAGVADFVWMILVSLKREWRVWIPVALVGALMCGCSFLTVLLNFPDA